MFFGLFLLRNGVWNVILTHSSNNEFQIFLASPVKKQGALFESYRGKNEFHCKIKIIFYAKYLSSLFWLVYISLCSVLRYFTFTFACFCMAKLYVLLTVSHLRPAILVTSLPVGDKKITYQLLLSPPLAVLSVTPCWFLFFSTMFLSDSTTGPSRPA